VGLRSRLRAGTREFSAAPDTATPTRFSVAAGSDTSVVDPRLLAPAQVAAAREAFAEAATAGDLAACYNLTRLALACAWDLAEASDWVSRGASAGHVGCLRLAGDVAELRGDLPAAVAWWSKAADAQVVPGDPTAAIGIDGIATVRQRALAMERLGAVAHVSADLADVVTSWENVAGSNHPMLVVLLGVAYATPAQAASARAWLARAVEHRSAAALCVAGLDAQRHGDLELAGRLWLEAADVGVPWAMAALARLALVAGESETARRWLHGAAEAGDPQAARASAALDHLPDVSDLPRRVFEDALAVGAGDRAEATARLGDAVALRHGPALTALGRERILVGDVEGGRAWLTEAVAEGEVDALVELGALAAGLGQTTSAIRFLTSAAGYGSVRAMIDLGVIHADTDDISAALGWLNRAAAAGDPEAMYVLGGRAGLTGDLVAAQRWWEAAAALGNQAAAQHLRDVFNVHLG
jgi:TPR repeat protein